MEAEILKALFYVIEIQICLFSAKKREAYLMEMKRLREGVGCMLPYPGLLGSLVAADMRLPLKPEFMAKLGTSHGRLSLRTSLVIMCLPPDSSGEDTMFWVLL